MEGRVATFAFNVAGVPTRDAAARLGDAGFAVWQGNYYALEVMNRLGLGDAGAVRAGIVHYNTTEEGRRPARRDRRTVTPVELLQQLIRFDTTNPPATRPAASSTCAACCRRRAATSSCTRRIRRGPTSSHDCAEAAAARRCCCKATSTSVTTSGQNWTRPPFGGELVDGYVWGRGALDMKGGVAMMVSAFLRAAQEQTQLPGDVILTVLADEENGGDFGAKFLVEDHAHLFEGVQWSLGEFGGFTLELGGRRLYPIQVAEKQICWLKARVPGRAGHGAMVQRGGTMSRLGKFLRDLDRKRTPVHVTPPARAMIEGIANAVARPQRDLCSRC
jgi:acetylornithine deacetylase/succinyl-diaminopimelate desuccinylase-like protein